MTRRRTKDHLQDILEASHAAQEFVDDTTFEGFSEDKKTVFAVIRALEIIGEATKRLPGVIREQHPDVPWREMAGMRDKLLHDYVTVDLRIVWRTVTEEIPVVEESIREILEDIP